MLNQLYLPSPWAFHSSIAKINHHLECRDFEHESLLSCHLRFLPETPHSSFSSVEMGLQTKQSQRRLDTQGDIIMEPHWRCGRDWYSNYSNNGHKRGSDPNSK